MPARRVVTACEGWPNDVMCRLVSVSSQKCFVVPRISVKYYPKSTSTNLN